MKLNERLKIAGRELGKANFGTAAKSLFSQSLTPSTYRGGSNSGFWWISEDGRCDVHFDYTGINSSLTAYTSCPPLTAIVNRKAKAFTNGKTWVLNDKGKVAEGAVADRIRALISQPNILQSFRQFEAQNYIYQQISEYCVALPIKPVGFDNTYATALWNLPPWMVEIKEKQGANPLFAKSLKDVIESVTFIYGNKPVPLDLDDIFIFKGTGISVSSLVIPENKICALKQVINNIIGAYESRGVLIEKRGPSMVISSGKSDASGDIPLTTKEKEDLEDQFMQRYGLMRKQARAIITSTSIKLDTVGFSTKELMLFEEIEDDIMRICDAYDFPYRLIASSRGNALGGSDAEYFNRQLYQDALIPEADNIYEQWNQFFRCGKYNLKIDKDFSHISSLQSDKLKEAQARNTLNDAKKKEFDAGLITLDQWLEALGEDPLPKNAGQVRVTDLKNSNVPLAVTIGVGGVQSLIQLLTARGISEEARQNAIEIVFGIPAADAARMVVGSDEANNQGNVANNGSSASSGNSGSDQGQTQNQ